MQMQHENVFHSELSRRLVCMCVLGRALVLVQKKIVIFNKAIVRRKFAQTIDAAMFNCLGPLLA